MIESIDDKQSPDLPELSEAGASAADALLPARSISRYNDAYAMFIKWVEKKYDDTSLTENVLLEYFTELSEKYKPSTMWAMYSMLKSVIKVNHNLNIGSYVKLKVFLRRKSKGFESKKSNVLTPENIQKFITEAPDIKYLATKVALIFGICGALRKDDLTNVTIDDVEDYNRLLLVRVPNSNLKNNAPRSFIIGEEFYDIVKKYEALRPKNVTSNRFFLNYQHGKCTSQVIGKNKFGGMPKQIAEYLKLPNPISYTGHSFRRTSATLLANAGAGIITIKQHGEWKSNAVADYIKDSINRKRKADEVTPSTNTCNLKTIENLPPLVPITQEKRIRSDTLVNMGASTSNDNDTTEDVVEPTEFAKEELFNEQNEIFIKEEDFDMSENNFDSVSFNSDNFDSEDEPLQTDFEDLFASDFEDEETQQGGLTGLMEVTSDHSYGKNRSGQTVNSEELNESRNLNEPNNRSKDDTKYMEQTLIEWKLRHNISNSAVSELLKVLKSHSCYSSLPDHSKMLLSSSRDIEWSKMDRGHYIHMGLKKKLMQIVEKDVTNMKYFINHGVQIEIFSDNLPLIKSTVSSVWAILAFVVPDSEIFIVGLYYGNRKPTSSNVYMKKLVDEIVELSYNGITIKNMQLNFKLHSAIFDMSTKSYILNVKNNYCTKCHVKGEHCINRVYFTDVCALKRTDAEFRNHNDMIYHIGVSELERIPEFDMVNNIPLDYMYVVCLGIMRKIMHLWITPSRKHANFLNNEQITVLSKSLKQMECCIPSEFSCKPRSLKYFKYYKASEFRLFLVYLGPVVMKNLLQDDAYHNFLALHIAIRICCDNLKDYLDFAEDLLKQFVFNFSFLFHQSFVSLNVHSAIHIVNDVRQFGSLDNYSGFRFDSFLQHLKNCVKKFDQTHQQLLYLRHCEKEYFYPQEDTNIYKEHLEPVISSKHEDEILPSGLSGPQYACVACKNFRLKRNTQNDSTCILKDGTAIEVMNFCYSDHLNQIVVLGRQYEKKTNFYDFPCESSLLDTCIVSQLSTVKHWPLLDVKRKLFKMPYKNNTFIVMPLIHNELNNERLIK